MALAWCLWNVVFGGAIASFYPTFLAESHSMSMQLAGTVASVTYLVTLALGPVAGVVIDKLNTRKWLMVFGFVGSSLFVTFAFGSNLALVWVYLVGMGVFVACVPTGVFAIIPRLAKSPAKLGFGMALITLCQNVGYFVGSFAFGPLSVSLGSAGDPNWQLAALLLLLPAELLALALVLFVRDKRSD